MLQYPTNLGLPETDDSQHARRVVDDEEETQHASNVTYQQQHVDSTMSVHSMGSGEISRSSDEAVQGTTTLMVGESNQNNELLEALRYSPPAVGGLEPDDLQVQTLHHVLSSVLNLQPPVRERIRDEGIYTMDDLYILEPRLRNNNDSILRAVERTKLLHFFDWVQEFHDFHHRLPDLEVDLSKAAFASFLERPRHRWPFGLSVDDMSLFDFPILHVMEPISDDDDDDEQSVDGYRTSSDRLREHYSTAERALQRFFASTDRDDWREFILHLKYTVHHTALDDEDYMLQAFSCTKLGAYLFEESPRDALAYLQRAALDFGVPTAQYLYAYFMLRGHGGVARDPDRAQELLRNAATMGLGEAHFALGELEESCTKMKIQWYRHAQRILRDAESCFGLTGQSYETEQMIPIELILVDRWSGVDTPSAAAATNTNVLVYWGFLVQGVLLGAVAVTAHGVQLHHYPALLVTVPLVGLAISGVHLIETARLAFPATADTARIEALETAFSLPPWMLYIVPPFHLVLLQYYKSSQPVDEHQTTILFLEIWGRSKAQRFLDNARDWGYLGVSMVLLFFWMVLLQQEVASRRQDCSDWGQTACQGASVECALRDTQLEICGLRIEV